MTRDELFDEMVAALDRVVFEQECGDLGGPASLAPEMCRRVLAKANGQDPDSLCHHDPSDWRGCVQCVTAWSET